MVRLRLCHVSRLRPAIVGDLEPRSTTVANHQYDYVTRRREKNQDLGIGDVELSQGHHHE